MCIELESLLLSDTYAHTDVTFAVGKAPKCIIPDIMNVLHSAFPALWHSHSGSVEVMISPSMFLSEVLILFDES